MRLRRAFRDAEATRDILVAATLRNLLKHTQLTLREAGLRHTLQRLGRPTLLVGGGVAANARLRDRLADMAGETGVQLEIAPRELCTDNAAMGAIAWESLERGVTAPLDIDATPGLIRRRDG